MIFVVISFDFGGSSDVTLHACTTSYDNAIDVYEKLSSKYESYNLKMSEDGAAKLVELLEVPDGFCSEKGHILYWGDEITNVKILKTNNKV